MCVWLAVSEWLCVGLCQSEARAAVIDEESSKQTIEVVGKQCTLQRCSASVTGSFSWLHREL